MTNTLALYDILPGMSQLESYNRVVYLNETGDLVIKHPVSDHTSTFHKYDLNLPIENMLDFVRCFPEHLRLTWGDIVKHSVFDLAAIIKHVLSLQEDNGLNGNWFSETISITTAPDGIFDDDNVKVLYVIRDSTHPLETLIVTTRTHVSAVEGRLDKLIRLLSRFINETNAFEKKIPSKVAQFKLNDYVGSNHTGLLTKANQVASTFYYGLHLSYYESKDYFRLDINRQLDVFLERGAKSLILLSFNMPISSLTTYPRLNYQHRCALLAFIYLANHSGLFQKP